MSSKGLAPGEIAVCPHGVDGARPYVRSKDDGQLETGLLRPWTSDSSASCDGVLEMGETVREGVRTVKRVIPFTARGPARVATDSFRSGWDATFGPDRAN